MSVSVTVDGTDRTSSLIRMERRDQYCDPGASVELVFDNVFEILPWKDVVVYENGTKTFTGTTSQIEASRDVLQLTIRASDDIRRIKEYFVAEDYETAGEGVKYWLNLFATAAGCSVSFDTDYDPTPLVGMTMGKMMAVEIVNELLLFAGWDMWCDADNTLHFGYRMTDAGVSYSLAAGDNLVGMLRTRDSESCRNRAIVYGAIGSAVAQAQFGWEIDDDDWRTMVVSSVYLETVTQAYDLANRMVSVAGPEWDIKRCDLDAVYEDIEIGDRVSFDDGVGNSGTDHVTTLTTVWEGDSGMETMHVVLGERCPIVGSPGAAPIDGRDVIVATYECGVWRCRDIWADTIHWESMNNGLEDDGLNCEWFIRDPFEPNTLAFLLTQEALYQTLSTEPGYEYWMPKHLQFEGDVEDWYIAKIRSTVARRGAYYFALTRKADPAYWSAVALSNDGCDTIRLADRVDKCSGQYTVYDCGVGRPPTFSGRLFGSKCNYTYQTECAVQCWHNPQAYGGLGGSGGLAAWHRNDHGCTITGLTSPRASNARPAYWHCTRASVGYSMDGVYNGDIAEGLCVDPDSVILSPWTFSRGTAIWFCYASGGILEYNICTTPNATGTISVPASSWTQMFSLHIPYNQSYTQDAFDSSEFPSIIYFTPGKWDGGVLTGITDRWPTRNGVALELPWGSSPASICHDCQGSIGTYSPDRTKVYCFSGGSPSRFATSDDEGDTWTEGASIPFNTACFSGFPYSSAKVYAGRHAIRDGTTDEDTALIYVSWDRGESWQDVTGDLYEQTKAMGRRYTKSGDPLGASGLVTIAPRYS